MILDFHTHLGDIFPTHRDIQLTTPAPSPHYLMISSPAVEDPDCLFYRKRPHPFSFGFLKHAAITWWRRRRTWQGMVIPNLLDDMQRYGITKSIVHPIEYDDGIDRSSSLIRECERESRLIPFCSVHPNDPLSIEKLRAYLQMGARGLKLHPNFQQILLNDPRYFPLYHTLADSGCPLLVHSGVTGRERTSRIFSSLELLEALPRHFPHVPVILAHAGITQYQQAIDLACHYDNIYLEISGQPAQHIREAVAAVGADRLLFGSDWPFWNQALALQAVRRAVRGNPKAEQQILSENAERLLHLDVRTRNPV